MLFVFQIRLVGGTAFLATVDAADIRGLGTAQTVVRRGAASP